MKANIRKSKLISKVAQDRKTWLKIRNKRRTESSGSEGTQKVAKPESLKSYWQLTKEPTAVVVELRRELQRKSGLHF
ncbi:hypothetical protein TNCV_4077271 [Trichonephila clavipes]|uniref:Uncharacterized protein n=1 Tax=Trichonephila clavipes TaxID=2585209 RepID=A0A8X6R2W6_TRICX|nr:hypothetical protein TNCV_4077271 [Trichonephila clavipes]